MQKPWKPSCFKTYRINFLSEIGIDAGGPKMEFFIESRNQMKISILKKGVPIKSIEDVSGQKFFVQDV